MTAREAAEYLRVSREHFWRLRLEFEIPTIRVGRGLRFRKDDLDRWMVECEEQVRSEQQHRARSCTGGEQHQRGEKRG